MKSTESTWADIESEIKRVVAKDSEFESETIANARDLINFMRTHCPPPEVGRGYRRTIKFFWQSGDLEIEIFSKCFEIYQFTNGTLDRITVVEHIPGAPLPAELLARLPKVDD